MNRLPLVILACLLLAALCGCEEDELAKAAREAAKQSAEQQRQLAQMQADVAPAPASWSNPIPKRH